MYQSYYWKVDLLLQQISDASDLDKFDLGFVLELDLVLDFDLGLDLTLALSSQERSTAW